MHIFELFLAFIFLTNNLALFSVEMKFNLLKKYSNLLLGKSESDDLLRENKIEKSGRMIFEIELKANF